MSRKLQFYDVVECFFAQLAIASYQLLQYARFEASTPSVSSKEHCASLHGSILLTLPCGYIAAEVGVVQPWSIRKTQRVALIHRGKRVCGWTCVC